MNATDMIRISEIFGPTIQGEGVLIGEPTVFIRTAGCDFRCSWCDTLHAVDSASRHTWRLLDVDTIWAEVHRLSGGKPLTISLSGGNPAIQPLEALLHKGQQEDYRFAMETQGSLFKPWFEKLDTLVVSPKPPSSNMKNDWQTISQCFALSSVQTILKIPVLDETDYQFARMTQARFPHVKTFLQPINQTPPSLDETQPDGLDMDDILDRFRWLIARCMEDQWYDVRLLPQLHVLVWGNLKGV